MPHDRGQDVEGRGVWMAQGDGGIAARQAADGIVATLTRLTRGELCRFGRQYDRRPAATGKWPQRVVDGAPDLIAVDIPHDHQHHVVRDVVALEIGDQILPLDFAEHILVTNGRDPVGVHPEGRIPG